MAVEEIDGAGASAYRPLLENVPTTRKRTNKALGKMFRHGWTQVAVDQCNLSLTNTWGPNVQAMRAWQNILLSKELTSIPFRDTGPSATCTASEAALSVQQLQKYLPYSRFKKKDTLHSNSTPVQEGTGMTSSCAIQLPRAVGAILFHLSTLQLLLNRS